MSLTRSLFSIDTGGGTRRFQRFVTLGGAKPSGEQPPRPRACSIRTSFGRRSRTPSASWIPAC